MREEVASISRRALAPNCRSARPSVSTRRWNIDVIIRHRTWAEAGCSCWQRVVIVRTVIERVASRSLPVELAPATADVAFVPANSAT